MPVDPLSLLDRQHEKLQSKSGAAFIREAIAFHAFLTTGPSEVVDAVIALRREAAEMEARFEAHDEELVPELVALRHELVEVAPTADDSGRARPAGPPTQSERWAMSLANFDLVAEDADGRILNIDRWDRSRSRMLLRILEGKLDGLQWWVDRTGPVLRRSETNQRPDLDDLARRVGNLAARHRHAAQAFEQAVETHGGFQIAYLDATVAQANPEPAEVVTEEDRHAAMDRALRNFSGGWHAIRRAASGRDLNENDELAVRLHVDRIRPAAERVYDDVFLRLATSPQPAPPAPDYAQRVLAYIRSPDYQLLGTPCIGAGVAAGAAGEDHWAWLLVAAFLLAILPPWLPQLSSVRLSYTRTSVAFIVLATLAVVVVMLGVSVLASLAVVASLSAAFTLGRLARADSTSAA